MSHRKSRFAEMMQHLLAQINNFMSLHPEKCIDLINKVIEFFEDGGEDEIVSEAAEDLKAWENTKLTIAVTGDTGAGKSSFINAFRRLRPGDVGAAPVGVRETTQKPDSYEHPNLPNVIFWDLPGIGTQGFPPETYLKQVKFSRYDFFIIVCSKRFRTCDVRLAREIQAMGKKFYFVRSKVDEDLSNAEKTNPEKYSEEQILQEIRDDCKKNLEKHLRASNPQIFLTSCWDPDKYDFPLLLETLEKDLPSLKRLAFLLSLPHISPEVIQKKKDALKKQSLKISVVSAFVNAMPLGDLKVSYDADRMVKTITGFYKKFGLDDGSLARLARQMKKPVEELKVVIQSPPEKDIAKKLWVKQCASEVGQILSSSFPGKGHVVSGVFSFVATYWTLSEFLDQLAEDAKGVLLLVESSVLHQILKGEGSLRPRGKVATATTFRDEVPEEGVSQDLSCLETVNLEDIRADDRLEEPEDAEETVAEDFIGPNSIYSEEAGPSHRIDSAPSEPHTIQVAPEQHISAYWLYVVANRLMEQSERQRAAQLQLMDNHHAEQMEARRQEMEESREDRDKLCEAIRRHDEVLQNCSRSL
ncbi:PREDICTED: interferon-inducible GTPase 5-like [Gekko japonicus]|uniref:Interferon-inducible GTPase 5-like n=1 Tax=Gekko japonicus TaxID=146911 RepID=A0ABM1KC03_GEKJA|nr:PREDICTED: interferon-inducible GTPase 5-like [Gekko japonicus]